MCWIIIGRICQIIYGSLTSLTVYLFCQIFTIYELCDQNEQYKESLKWMCIFSAITIISFFLEFCFNHSLTIAVLN